MGALPKSAQHHDVGEDVGEYAAEAAMAQKLDNTFSRAAKRHAGLMKALSDFLNDEEAHTVADLDLLQAVMKLPKQDPLVTLGANLGESLTQDHVDERYA